jgi:hypothetical protein
VSNRFSERTESKAFTFSEIERFTDTIEHHTNLLKVLFNAVPESRLGRYKKYLNNFFESVYDCISERQVIDSSKYPLRAHILSRVSRHTVSVVFLQRKPSDVVRSFAKKDIEQPAKSFVSANLYYLLTNFLALLVYRFLPNNVRKCRVYYEDVVNRPEDTMEYIGEKLSLDLQAVSERIKKQDPLLVAPLFEGNRLRLKQEVFIQKPKTKKKFTWKDVFTNTLNGLVYQR